MWVEFFFPLKTSFIIRTSLAWTLLVTLPGIPGVLQAAGANPSSARLAFLVCIFHYNLCFSVFQKDIAAGKTAALISLLSCRFSELLAPALPVAEAILFVIDPGLGLSDVLFSGGFSFSFWGSADPSLLVSLNPPLLDFCLRGGVGAALPLPVSPRPRGFWSSGLCCTPFQKPHVGFFPFVGS